MSKIELKLGPLTFSFECDRIEQGTAINPVLPAAFDHTDNNARPNRHLAWWDVPYILEHKLENGVTYELRCLNGGSWDRSTWCGTFPTLAAALEEVLNATKDYGGAARERSHQIQAKTRPKFTIGSRVYWMDAEWGRCTGILTSFAYPTALKVLITLDDARTRTVARVRLWDNPEMATSAQQQSSLADAATSGELYAVVAEHVMGWRWVIDAAVPDGPEREHPIKKRFRFLDPCKPAFGEWEYWNGTEELPIWQERPITAYSTDGNAMLAVLRAIWAMGLRCQIGHTPDGAYLVEVLTAKPAKVWRVAEVCAAELPEAVCRAALKAFEAQSLEHEKDEPRA